MLLASFSSAAANSVFLSETNYPSGEFPSAAAVSDLNNAGILDIVSANSNAHNLGVFLGRADGTFDPITFAVRAGAVEVAAIAESQVTLVGICAVSRACILYSFGPNLREPQLLNRRLAELTQVSPDENRRSPGTRDSVCVCGSGRDLSRVCRKWEKCWSSWAA